MSDRFLSDRELAQYLGCSARTVRRHRQRGLLPTRGLGRARGCLESELLRALGVGDVAGTAGDAPAAGDVQHETNQTDRRP